MANLDKPALDEKQPEDEDYTGVSAGSPATTLDPCADVERIVPRCFHYWHKAVPVSTRTLPSVGAQVFFSLLGGFVLITMVFTFLCRWLKRKGRGKRGLIAIGRKQENVSNG